MNEGVLTKISLGGERAHTDDHPPVLLSLPLATGVSGQLAPGLLLKVVSAENAYAPLLSTDSDTPVAVVDKPCDAGTETSALCLVHGCCKFRLLATADGKAPSQAQITALMQNNIYSI